MTASILRALFTKPVGPYLLAEAFRTSFLAYLLLLLIEYLAPGSASRYVPMTTVLVTVLVSGVGAALFPEPPRDSVAEKRKPRFRDFFFVALLSVLGAVLIYAKTQSIGRIAAAIAILSGIIIGLLSLLLLFGDEESDGSGHD